MTIAVDAGAAPARHRPRVARRPILRWAWRLFRREWRQQVLVLGLMVLAVAATVTGVAVAASAAPSRESTFGRANTMLSFSRLDQQAIDAARVNFGTIEVVSSQTITIPGSVDTYPLRAQRADGVYSAPLLRLDRGRMPRGAGEIALTQTLASRLGVHLGGTMTVNDQARRVVGIVENPLDLGDHFALVAPGQIASPSDVTVFTDASQRQMSAFRPPADLTGIGQESTLSKDNAAVAVLALEIIGMLFVGLVAAAGFAVMAQRRQRALGMLGALGASDAQVRFTMLANGVVVGAVGAVVGALAGFLVWLALAPRLEDVSAHRVDRLGLPWWAIATAMLLAVATSVAAAWWPARAAARASIVAALSERPAPPKPAHRFAALGGGLLLTGFVSLAFADRTTPNAFLVVAGTIATTFGMLFVGPLCIRALAVVARRAPVTVRLALRDLARYQARSAAALAAISLALAIASTVVISASALNLTHEQENLPANEVVLSLETRNRGFFVNGLSGMAPRSQASIQSAATAASNLATQWHASSIPLLAVLDPHTGTVKLPDAPIGPKPGPGVRAAPVNPQTGTISVVVPAQLGRLVRAPRSRRASLGRGQPLYVATPALLRALHIDAHAIAADTDVVTYAGAPHQILTLAPLDAPGPARGVIAHDAVVQTMKMPTDTSEPRALITEHGLRRFGLQTAASGWLIRAHDAIGPAQLDAADTAAANADTSVESHHPQPSYNGVRTGATTAGILVALGVLAMTVGLIRSETARDLRTLTATGATSTARRTLTGATAGTLALLGAVLGTATAYLALIAWHRSELHQLTRVPYANLVTIIVVLPVLAFVAGWLLAGREPSEIARRPLE
ncbi:MAG TPA: FtsX-like permease family protein [Acidimicrobiia bacterium]|nr:FtsX-like permease family protein [Acidimicrobiia bacterium]